MGRAVERQGLMDEIKKKDERRKVLLVGAIGAGKTMRAREIASECGLWWGRDVDRAYAYRVAGLGEPTLTTAPFRAPHHSVSVQGMIGKLQGHRFRPGELQLAHGGVLFLDQPQEFSREVRELVEAAWNWQRTTHSSPACDIKGRISMQQNVLYVPTVFTLVVASTPCPCGWRGARIRGSECPCTDEQVADWMARLGWFAEGAERFELQRPDRVEAVAR